MASKINHALVFFLLALLSHGAGGTHADQAFFIKTAKQSQQNGRWDQVIVVRMNDPFVLFQFSTGSTILLTVSMALSWMVAIIGKYTIFHQIAASGIRQIPINLLILAEQVINTLYRQVVNAFKEQLS